MKYATDILESMVGKTYTKVTASNEIMTFENDSEAIDFYHQQSCCENVRIEDICGDINDLVGSPITMAEEVDNFEAPPLGDRESYTWTFYKFATQKGYVTVRWLGTSNGYYSERVDIERREKKNKKVDFLN